MFENEQVPDSKVQKLGFPDHVGTGVVVGDIEGTGVGGEGVSCRLCHSAYTESPLKKWDKRGGTAFSEQEIFSFLQRLGMRE